MASEELLAETKRCNRCGYCQPPCPVFRATGVESSCARGRIQLLKSAAEGRVEFGPELEPAIFECLLCRACVEACAPKAQTDRIVAMARERWFRECGQSLVTDTLFREVLADRRRMEAVARLAFAGIDSGAARAAQVLGLLRLEPRAGRALDWLGRTPGPSLTQRLAKLRLAPPGGATRRVGYFVSCGMNLLQPAAGESTVRLLSALGCEVVPLDNVCCGLPAYVYGDWEAARRLLTTNARVLAAAGPLDAVVTDCGSCSSHLRHAASLMGLTDPELDRLPEQVADLAEFVQRVGARPAEPVPLRATYHDPCHLSRHQRLTAQPRALLSAVADLEYVELPEADWCCGGAGSYGLEHAEISRVILERKMRNVEETEADVLVTACPACMTQLALGARRGGLRTTVRHLSHVLARAYGAEVPRATPESGGVV